MALRFKTKQGNLKVVPTKEEVPSGGSTNGIPVVSPDAGETTTGTTDSSGDLLYTRSFHVEQVITDASEHIIELTILGVNKIWSTYGTVIYGGDQLRMPINTTYPWNSTYLYCMVYVDAADNRLKLKLKGYGKCTVDVQIIYSKTS